MWKHLGTAVASVLFIRGPLAFVAYFLYENHQRRAVERAECVEELSFWDPVAEQGETYAKFIIGGLYLAQTPCRDDEKALRWTQEAANEGHRKAQFTLGAIYGEGLGVRTDLTEMESWYRKSAPKRLRGSNDYTTFDGGSMKV